MTICLKPVTLENWFLCTDLKVKPEQRSTFPAPVVNWIAESKFMNEFELRAIYANETLVGFLVYCSEPDENQNYWIPALMIDEKYQGNGYGKAAMLLLIEHMRSLGYTKLMIGHRPNNFRAGQLYESLGFMKISDALIDGEIVRLLQVNH